SEADVPFSKLFRTIMSGKIKFRIKPHRRLPMVVPVGGRKVELISTLQLVQCYKCLRFGHTKVKCPSLHKVTYHEFNKNFRLGLGLPTKIAGADERIITEGAARREEEEEAEDMERSLEEEQTEDSGLHEEGRRPDVEQKTKDCSLDQQNKSSAASGEYNSKSASACELSVLDVSGPGDSKNHGMRDDWVRVMHRGSSIPMKKNYSDHELKNNKRSFNSPETECKKRTRDSASKSLEAVLSH
ncbi:Hypothetical protein FKW44_018565, partial [Caligus rogercresseyi]